MPLRVAVATRTGETVHMHFGHATHFHVYDVAGTSARLVEVRQNQPGCGSTQDRHAAHRRTLDLLSDCQAIVVSCVGPGALRAIEARGIACYETEDPVADALRRIAELELGGRGRR